MTEEVSTTTGELNTQDPENLLELPGGVDGPLPTGVAISALAMNFALKFCTVNTISDGALYQQLKLEGKNLQHGWHLDQVLDISCQIEKHLLAGSDRIAGIVAAALIQGMEGEEPEAEEGQ